MIIFDLDGVLADCEHRRHFVDPIKAGYYECGEKGSGVYAKEVLGPLWEPNLDAFYEACDKDTPIQPVIDIWNKEISLGMMGIHQIWTGRSESVRKKTEIWLGDNLLCFQVHQLKMRPIGDSTSNEYLKEMWLNGQCADLIEHHFEGKPYPTSHNIEYVFDSDPASILMWRRRGIFVFNCNQSDMEF